MRLGKNQPGPQQGHAGASAEAPMLDIIRTGNFG